MNKKNQTLFVLCSSILVGIILSLWLFRTKFSQTTPLTKPIANFRMLYHNGVSHELYYYRDAKAIVLIWQGNGWPIARLGMGEIKRLKEKYEKDGVKFFLVNANPQDDLKSIEEEAKEFNFPLPVLKDEIQAVSESLGVTRTTTAVMISPKNWQLTYFGPITDALGYETQKTAKEFYLENAIVETLAGEAPKKVEAPVKGCLINYLHPKEKVT